MTNTNYESKPAATTTWGRLPVERLSLELGPPSRGEQNPHEVLIYGDSLHQTNEEVLSRYQRDGIESFLRWERRHSLGSYVLVDRSRTRTRLISSPGYCGGYYRENGARVYVATLLREVLHREPSSILIREEMLYYLVTYAPTSAFGSLPCSTLFENVRRFGPATVLDVGLGGVERIRSFAHVAESDRPETLMTAIMEVADQYARYYRHVGEEPTVLFSGGADSLLIYLALEEIVGRGNVRAITVQTSRFESLTNGHYRAIPVAQRLGVDIEIVTGDWEADPRVNVEIRRQMGLEMINSRRPDLALSGRSDLPQLIVHGQNMDSMAGNGMVNLDANDDRPILSAKQLPLVSTDQLMLGQLRTLVSNFQFASEFYGSSELQLRMAPFMQHSSPLTLVDPDAGTELGLLRGLIATQRPNLVHNARKPFSRVDQIALMTEEAGLFRDLVGQSVGGVALCDLARFYGYTQLALKRGCSVPLENGVNTSFYPMAGAVLSYFLGRTRTMSDAFSPKEDVYRVIEQLSGVSYSELRGVRDAEMNEQIARINDQRGEDKRDTFIENNRELLDDSASNVLAKLSTHAAREPMLEVFRLAAEGSDPLSDSFTVFNQSVARQLINLELLLREPDGGGGSTASADRTPEPSRPPVQQTTDDWSTGKS